MRRVLWRLRICTLGRTSQVTVDECVRCRILIGPCEGSVFVRNCTDCTITVACKQFRTRECERCDVYLYALTDPIIESSHAMRIGPFNGGYAHLDAQMKAVGFDPRGSKHASMYAQFAIGCPRISAHHAHLLGKGTTSRPAAAAAARTGP